MTATKSNPHGLVPGMTLWRVGARGSGRNPPPGEAVTVGKVGRVWADIGGGLRVNLTDLRVNDRRLDVGRCHLSEDDYRRSTSADDAWTSFKRALIGVWVPPASEAAIREAAALLGLHIPKEGKP